MGENRLDVYVLEARVAGMDRQKGRNAEKP